MATRYAGLTVRASDTEVLWARKVADESVTASTTMQDDDALLVQVEANRVYEFDALIGYVGNTAGDVKVGFTFPAGASCYWAGQGGSDGDSGYGGVGASRHSASFGDASGTATAFTGSTTALAILVKGMLVVGGTPGVLRLQWAQNTSNATATTVKAGSFLRAQARE